MFRLASKQLFLFLEMIFKEYLPTKKHRFCISINDSCFLKQYYFISLKIVVMNYVAITGDALFLSLLAISGIIVLLIFGIRKYVQHQKTKVPTGTQNLLERNKYALVNTFKMSGTLFNIGLLTALSMTILAFSWTTYDYERRYEQPVFDENFDMEITIDRTIQKKSPPPPPLPEMLIPEIVEPEEIVTEVEFVEPEIIEPELTMAPSASVVEKIIVPVAPSLPPPPEPVKPIVDVPFTVVEEMPRFPGCEDISDKAERNACAQQNLLNYIYREIKYPTIASETGIEGTVVVRFYIDEKGNVKAPEILKGIGGGCGKEVLRVVKTMNNMSEKWTPGRQRGRTVKVYFNLPVKYKLN